MVLVDIGGGTTDVAIFTGGAIRHTAVLPIAGDQITNDIAAMLRTPTPDAEEIKLRYGVAKQCWRARTSPWKCRACDRGPRQVKRQALGAVIEPRVEELFTLVQQVVRDSGYEDLLASGVVLTGGSAQLPGMVELAEDVFLKPVRVAVPEYEGSLADVMRNPRLDCDGAAARGAHARVRGRKVAAQTGNFKSLLARMKEWFMN